MTGLLALDAEYYVKNSSSQYSQAKSLLKLVDIKKNFSILDVGCGHGHIIAEISQRIPEGKAIGIDSSKEMITLAKSKFPGTAYRNLQYFHMKAEAMSFDKQNFDLIICSNVLMWVKEPAKAIELMVDFLKPYGNLAIFTYPTDTPYTILFEEVLNELFPELREYSAISTMLTPIQYKESLKAHNLEIQVFESTDIAFYYEDYDDFKNYVRGWLICYVPLTEIQQESFLKILCKKIHEKGFYTSDGRIAIPHQTLRILAKKP